MLPRLRLWYQEQGSLYFFIEVGGDIRYARATWTLGRNGNWPTEYIKHSQVGPHPLMKERK